LDVSDAVEITNQHHNTPPGWWEEPVGDADRSRIDESGRIPRSSERGKSKFNTQISGTTATAAIS
jgi:hypothetical protein